MNNGLSKFADNIKLFGLLRTKADCDGLQKDLTRLGLLAII